MQMLLNLDVSELPVTEVLLITFVLIFTLMVNMYKYAHIHIEVSFIALAYLEI